MYTNSQVEVVFKRITSFRFLPATPLQQPTTSRSTAMLAPWPNQFRGAKNCAKNREKLVVGPQHTRKIWKYGFSMCGYWNHTGLPLWSLQTNTFENSNLSGSVLQERGSSFSCVFCSHWVNWLIFHQPPMLWNVILPGFTDQSTNLGLQYPHQHNYPNAENTRICNFTRICDFCT